MTSPNKPNSSHSHSDAETGRVTAADLERWGQSRLAKHLDSLGSESQAALLRQLEGIDFEQLQQLTSGQDQHVDWAALAKRADAPVAVRLQDPNPLYSAEAARAAGEAALREGKIGLILVAGGQGSRLGFEQPKGMYPVGPLSGRTLFQMHCDRLLAVMKRFDVSIPMYVMTSPATDAETREYFQQQSRCGLAEDQLIVFCQGTMPAVDAQTGELLLASASQLALSPDGHGGLVAALAKRGCLDDAKRRGIDHFYYAQVDNPLAELCDAELIGYHLLACSEMTTQVVTKRFAKEKVGNVVQVDGKVQIIEYSDLPDEAAEQKAGDGSLKFWAGNIAIHVFQREFLESVVQSVAGLPFHRAHKKVAHLDATGKVVEPQQPNAIKFERFVFDLLPLAKGAIVVEGDASKVFAPVKNANGGPVDTPQHTQSALINLHMRWLTLAGATLEDGVQVEIHPDWALDAAEVAGKVDGRVTISTDTYLR